MKYAMTAAALAALVACSPAAQPEAEKAKPGEVSEVTPGTDVSSDDIIVPDESVPADEADSDAADAAADAAPGAKQPEGRAGGAPDGAVETPHATTN